jgi:hypothetical protein
LFIYPILPIKNKKILDDTPEFNARGVISKCPSPAPPKSGEEMSENDVEAVLWHSLNIIFGVLSPSQREEGRGWRDGFARMKHP